jgi:hypothetical protein
MPMEQQKSKCGNWELILDSICLSYTEIYMYSLSNQWMGNEHGVPYWRELPLEVLLHVVVAADEDVSQFDAMFPYAQKNTTSDLSVPCQFVCASVVEVSCCLFISWEYLVAMKLICWELVIVCSFPSSKVVGPSDDVSSRNISWFLLFRYSRQ